MRPPAARSRRRAPGAGRAEDRLHPGVRRARASASARCWPDDRAALLERAAAILTGWAIRSGQPRRRDVGRRWPTRPCGSPRAIQTFDLGAAPACARGRPQPPVDVARPRRRGARRRRRRSRSASSSRRARSRTSPASPAPGWRSSTRRPRPPSARRWPVATSPWSRLPDDGLDGDRARRVRRRSPAARAPPRSGGAPQPAVHVGHDRPPEGGPAAARRRSAARPTSPASSSTSPSTGWPSCGPHLVVGPLYHNGPLTAVRLLLAGVPIVVHERFDAEATLAAIDQHRIESSIMVPTHFVRCLALPHDVREPLRRVVVAAGRAHRAASARSTSSGR